VQFKHKTKLLRINWIAVFPSFSSNDTQRKTLQWHSLKVCSVWRFGGKRWCTQFDGQWYY